MGKGKPSWLLVASLAFAVAGAATVITGSGGIDIQPLGIVFAFSASCAFSAYLLGAEFALRKTSPLTSALWVCVWASVGCSTFAVVSSRVDLPSAGTATWAVLGMGLASAAAFVCMLTGLRMVGAVRASIISSMEPLAAALLAFFLLSETVSAGTFLGGAMILVGAIGASLARPQAPPEPNIP
jgi:drug/metabolite transporter (DMT)-like permease